MDLPAEHDVQCRTHVPAEHDLRAADDVRDLHVPADVDVCDSADVQPADLFVEPDLRWTGDLSAEPDLPADGDVRRRSVVRVTGAVMVKGGQVAPLVFTHPRDRSYRNCASPCLDIVAILL